MIIKIPTKEVECCDLCGREVACLDTCISCGVRHCMLCEAVIAGCVQKPTVCSKCGKKEEVLHITEKYALQLAEIVKARDEELSKLKI